MSDILGLDIEQKFCVEFPVGGRTGGVTIPPRHVGVALSLNFI